MPDNRKDQTDGTGTGTGTDDEMGEGNRAADRQYREDVKKYVDSGRPNEAGKEAQRDLEDDDKRGVLEEAERIGRSRSADADSPIKKH